MLWPAQCTKGHVQLLLHKIHTQEMKSCTYYVQQLFHERHGKMFFFFYRDQMMIYFEKMLIFATALLFFCDDKTNCEILVHPTDFI